MKFTENDGVLLPRGVRIILSVTAIIAVVILSAAVVRSVKNRDNLPVGNSANSSQSSKTDSSSGSTPAQTGNSPDSSGNTTEEESTTESPEDKIKNFAAKFTDQYISSNTEAVFSEYANSNGKKLSDYPDYLIEFVGKYPQTLAFALAYPDEYGENHKINMSEYKDLSEVPHFIQWDKRWGYIDYGDKVLGVAGCGPTCLSMVAYYLTGGSSEMTPDKIAKFSIDNGYCAGGTPWTFFSQGAKKLGLNVKELTLDERKIEAELEQKHPIVCNVKEGIFTTGGHYIVLTKYENGRISVNDPNSYVNTNRTYSFDEIKDQIRNLWAFSK